MQSIRRGRGRDLSLRFARMAFLLLVGILDRLGSCGGS